MKQMKFRIKTKIMFMNMAIFVPVILFVCAVLLNQLYSSIIKNSTDFLLKESYNTQLYMDRYFEQHAENPPDKRFAAAAPLIGTYLANKVDFRIQLYDRAGNLLSDSIKNDLSMYAEDIAKAGEGKKAYIMKKTEEHTYILFSSPIYVGREIIGSVRYIYPLERETKIMDSMFLMMVVVVSAAVFISWILSNLFAGEIAGPIRKLKLASEKNTQGDYGHEMHINSGDEVEELAETFNHMTRSIQNYISSLKEEKQKQKKFFDHVTHEFRTPLTAIIGYAELIPRLRQAEQVKESLYYIRIEGNRLLKLVEELLELSRLGQNEFDITKTSEDIQSVLEEVVYIMQPRLDKYKISLKKQLDQVQVEIDKDKTKQVFLNIFDNAVKYSECEQLSLTVCKGEKEVIVTLSDDGQGIEPEKLTRLFDPMQRLSNVEPLHGNGLGLCICKEIMEKQGGRIEVHSGKNSGTTVKLIFLRGECNYGKRTD